MIRLTPQLLIATAGALVASGAHGEITFREEVPRKDDATCAPRVEHEGSWDVAFLQHCGYWSHYDYGVRKSSWPMPREMSINEMALFALAHEVLHDKPQPGDIFLQYAKHRGGFVHAGLVVSVLASEMFGKIGPYFDVYTIEGDTDECGELQRGRAMRVRRRLSPRMGDQFFRWVDLEFEAGAVKFGMPQRAYSPRWIVE